jgi:carboxymethylenebutenolidase
MAVQEATLDVATPAGPMRCYLALPERRDPAPGVIVVQEVFGVNGSIQEAALRLARAGYVALAPELFHRSAAPGQVFPYDFTVVQPHFAQLTNEAVLEDLTAARDALAAHPRVRKDKLGVVGFCAGGFSAWLAAGKLGLQAAVPFYAGGLVRLRPGLKLQPCVAQAPTCPTLCFFGGKDQSIPPSDIAAIGEALSRAPAGSEVVVYPEAGHAFGNADRPANYHHESAEAAWAKTLAFLGAHLA